MKRLLNVLLALGMTSGLINAQLMVTDHEGNEYEFAKMADNRNWMLENLRATTDLEGNPLHVYWRGTDLGGYATQEEAAFMVGFADLREEVLGSSGSSAVRTYSARTRGICPEGWHVPEYGGTKNTTADYNALILAYGGKLGSFLSDANWDAFRDALRLTPNGYSFGKFMVDPVTFEVVQGKTPGGQIHLITSGHTGRTNPATMMNVGGGALTWGGVEDAEGYAGYCRCVENIQAKVTFSNFSAFGVDVTFSEALLPNYAFDEKVTIDGEEISVKDICSRNFLIKEYGTEIVIPVNNIFKSEDSKMIQIEADFDENKIYELVMVDSKLREANVPYGGYTFNGGTRMYFPKAPSGVNLLEEIELKINVVDDVLVIEQFAAVLDASVFDMNGKEQIRLKNLQGTEYVNIANLSKGIYLLQLRDEVRCESIVKKFIVK